MRVGRVLMRSPHAGAWPYEFHVVNDKKINAFSLPGGFIFVNTGAIDACEDETQLAGILAHEMSHVNLRHGTRSSRCDTNDAELREGEPYSASRLFSIMSLRRQDVSW